MVVRRPRLNVRRPKLATMRQRVVVGSYRAEQSGHVVRREQLVARSPNK